MKRTLLSAICCLALCACGKETPIPSTESASPAVGKAVDAAQQKKQGELKIKGLYLGMDIRDVPGSMVSILAERVLSDFGFTDVIRITDGKGCVLMYSKSFLRAIEGRMQERYGAATAASKVDGELATSCVNSDGVLAVHAGADNRVYRIEFNDVKDLFGTQGGAPAGFAKALSQEFGLPELKPNTDNTVWRYVDAEGSRVEVTAREMLGIPMLRVSMSKPE